MKKIEKPLPYSFKKIKMGNENLERQAEEDLLTPVSKRCFIGALCRKIEHSWGTAIKVMPLGAREDIAMIMIVRLVINTLTLFEGANRDF